VGILLKSRSPRAVCCAYCHGEIEVPQGAVECPGCSTAVHKDCRYQISTCPTLGCTVRRFRPLADGNAWERARSGADRYERVLGAGIAALVATVVALSIGYGFGTTSGGDTGELAAVPPRIYVKVEAAPEPLEHQCLPIIVLEEEVEIAPPPTIQELCLQLADGETRLKASEALIKHGPRAVRAVAWTLEVGGTLLQRREAAYVLQEISAKHDLSGILSPMTLARAIAEGDDLVADCSRHTLARLGDLAVAELVVAATRENFASSRIAAAGALTYIGATLPCGFVSVLSDPDSAVRAQGIAAYDDVTELLPATLTALKGLSHNDPVPELRAMARLLIASHQKKSLAPKLKHAMVWQLTQPQNDANTLRLCRAFAAKRMPDDVLTALYEALPTENVDRRVHVVESLGVFARLLTLRRSASQKLCKTLEATLKDDTDERVRAAAERALATARTTNTSTRGIVFS
jgi:hypothetical protein